MRSVMIIGGGAQGNVLCGVLSRAHDVERIVLGDVALDRAKEVAHFVGSDKIDVERVDASNVSQMERVMRAGSFDLIVNATLPLFNRQIMEATLKAKANYLDMASGDIFEKNGGLSVDQLEFAGDFEAAGLKAFILMGSDAGLVNLMAKEAADELDEIDYIGIKDYGILECDEPVARACRRCATLPRRIWRSMVMKPERS